jgi:hypothetical protein
MLEELKKINKKLKLLRLKTKDESTRDSLSDISREIALIYDWTANYWQQFLEWVKEE